MANVQISDQVFEAAERRATAEGYSSVAEYVADLVKHDVEVDAASEEDDLDQLFSPERLAEIEAAEVEVRTGKSFTADQVRENFKRRSEAWHQKNAAR